MNDSLVQAYLPLLIWPGLGLILFKFLPDQFPRWLGRGLYWVGVPLEIFALAHQTNFSQDTGLAPLYTLLALGLGLGLALLGLQGVVWYVSRSNSLESPDSPARSDLPDGPEAPEDADHPVALKPSSRLDSTATVGWQSRSRQGSFVISAMISNTGFVGLAIVPAFVSAPYLGWVVFFSVTNNVLGTYGIGVWLASYFGRGFHAQSRWQQLKDVLTVPSLWAFGLGYSSHRWEFPPLAETALHSSIWVVIPVALLLMGMRLSQLQGWESLKLALVPSLIKILVLPALVGGVAITAGLPHDASLTLVLMSGMPSAFAGLILAEEYELDRELMASSIALTTLGLLFTIPIWLVLFGPIAG